MGGSFGQSANTMIYIVFLITITSQILSGQAQSRLNNAIVPFNATSSGRGHTHIEMIDVKCENGNDILVTIEFEDTFYGVNNYVKAGGSARSYTFKVPYNGCGSKPSCAVCASIENILVIQSDEDVQVIWDTAKKITCSRAIDDEQGKTIIFKPFVVDMLEVVSVPTSQGGVDCWMDIQRGEFPEVQPLTEIIKIGETLSVLVFLRDPKNEYDLIVRDCWTFDHQDYDSKTTGRIQLSDKIGCSRKKNCLVHGRELQRLKTHNTLQAFKFPDRMQVFLKCDVEICRGECEEKFCDDIDNEVTPASVNIQSIRSTSIKPPSRGTPAVPRCYPGSRDSRCLGTTTTNNPPQMFYPSTLPEEPEQTTRTTQFPKTRPTRPAVTRTSTQKVRTTTEEPATYLPPSTISPPFKCTPGSRDPRCPQAARTQPPTVRLTRPVISTQKPPRCGPTSRDPRCPNVVTREPATYLPPLTTTQAPRTRATTRETTLPPLRCAAGTIGTYPDCYKPTTTPRPTLAPKCPQGTSGTYPNCQTLTTQPPRCGPGLIGEYPNCYAPTTTPRPTPPPKCQPGYTGVYPNCERPTPAPQCPSGYIGVYPNCELPTTQKPKECDPPYIAQYPNCQLPSCKPGYVGKYPNCSPATTTERPTTQVPTTRATTTRETTTRGTTSRATTSVPRCYPGSTDILCRSTEAPTTRASTTRETTTRGTTSRATTPAVTRTTSRVTTTQRITTTREPATYLPPETTLPPLRCAAGTIGTYPNCYKPTTTSRPTLAPKCPQGTSGTYPNCQTVTTQTLRCGPGLIGEYPNCYAPITTPRPTPPPKCQPGYTGVYPNCQRPTPAPQCPSGMYCTSTLIHGTQHGTILTDLLSFMLESTPTLGSTETSAYERKEYAKKSLQFNMKNETFKELFPEICTEIEQKLLQRNSVNASANGQTNSTDTDGSKENSAGYRFNSDANNTWQSLCSNLIVLAGFAVFALF